MLQRLFITILLVAVILAPTTASAKPWAWVWYPGEYQKPPGLYLGRLSFNIDSEVKAAYLFFSGDNFVRLYLNGKEIAGSGDWYTLKPVTIKTLGPVLQKGKNVLAARVQNDDYEGGFILRGMIMLANGKTIVLDSNDDWRCANKEAEGWQNVDFDDSRWVATEVIGTPPAGPWGTPTMPPSRNILMTISAGDKENPAGYSCDKATGVETIKVNKTAIGYLVLTRMVSKGDAHDVKVSINGNDAGVWHSASPSGSVGAAYFVVPYDLTNGQSDITITLSPVSGKERSGISNVWTTFEWYMFGDEAAGSLDRDMLAKKYAADTKDAVVAFCYGLALEGDGQWAKAAEAYNRCAALVGEGSLAESAVRSARLAEAMIEVGKVKNDAAKLFDLAMYLKANAFYAEAGELFRQSIKVKPTADAYDQLGEAMLFGGANIKECIAVWKKGLELAPPKDTNRWRCIITLRPTKEQEKDLPAQREQLDIMHEMIYLSSRGRMALDSQILVNPGPQDTLYKPATLDCFINVQGGAGGGVTFGPGDVYGNAGLSGFGFVTPWDVAWHEWIHQFECGLGASGNGWGWGGDHSSTQFGYRPPWWNWYRAAMRYYVRPGQYERACIVDHQDVPFADKWLVKGPFNSPEVSPEWICYPKKRNAANFAWNNRKTFTLADKPTEATIAATGDDIIVLYVNGHRVGDHGSWMAAPKFDITRYLKKGKNVIAIAALNGDYDGGILAHADITLPGGKKIVLATDESWVMQESTPDEFNKLRADKDAKLSAPDWTKATCNDSKWVRAEIIGKYPCPPWGKINMEMPNLLMETDFVSGGDKAPSASAGWKQVRLETKFGKLSEIAPSKDDAYQTLTYAFTYVYCPKDMRANMTMAASWRNFITLNGELIRRHFGNGGTTLPQVFPIELKKGWNRLLMKLEDVRKSGSFYVKIYNLDGSAIDGLKYSSVKPASDIVADQQTLPKFVATNPKRYNWADVAEDPYTLMPQLTAADLAAFTGIKGLTLAGGNNFLFIGLGDAKAAGYSPITKYSGGEHLTNNALTWDYEPMAVVRYARGGKTGDLLFVKPDALELIFQTGLLKTAEGSKHPSMRLLGWVLQDGRLAVAAEADLGELPARTMDLLTVK